MKLEKDINPYGRKGNEKRFPNGKKGSLCL